MRCLDTIEEIKRTYTVDQLREMFARREHDAMFEQVGRDSMTKKKKIYPIEKTGMRHLYVWRGYEILTDSPYLGRIR
jgi:hypothetical protein